MSNSEKVFEELLNEIVAKYKCMSEEELRKNIDENPLNIAPFSI